MAFAEPPGWYVISLRPQGGHESLRRAAVKYGARLIALSPWRLQANDDDATRQSLRNALASPYVLFTSPTAVTAAAALESLESTSSQICIAIGGGTAAALKDAGVARVEAPTRMDSEGVLALPSLARVSGVAVGLMTAPEGRDALVPALQARGARILRADVYRRVPVPLPKRALRKLRALDGPAFIALSSGGALARVLEDAPGDIVQGLRGMPVVAASARLQRMAHDAGFADVDLAEGPQPAQLLAVMARRFR